MCGLRIWFGLKVRLVGGENNISTIMADVKGRVRQFLMVVVAAIGLLSNLPSKALEITGAERAVLPVFCQEQHHISKGAQDPQRLARWESYMGSGTFQALHHYCWALVELARSYHPGYTQQDRNSMLKSAAGNIDYVIERSNRNSPLLPELYTAKGRALLLKGDIREAGISFDAARKIDPKYWRAYLLWAVFLQQNGKIKEAEKLVADGLEHSPDSKALRSLSDDLRRGTPIKREQR